jgi:hypothetical protein
MNTERSITVRWTQDGFHRWPEATGTREYLASRHRHLFYYEVTVTVEHGDREIEFHDLLDLCKNAISDKELGRTSCEELADKVLEKVCNVYPNRPRYSATVWEDNEVGATTVLNK